MAIGPTEERTEKLKKDDLQGPFQVHPDLIYRPVPEKISYAEVEEQLVWRVAFQLASDPEKQFGLDINGEIILGRNGDDESDIIDLNPYEAAELGVSRQHLKIRPTSSHLFLIDLESTNGTLRNGRSIGSHIPSRLISGDTITIGSLKFIVHIVGRPSLQTAFLERKSNLADAMAQIAKAITSQLDIDDVLNQIAEAAMVLTSAAETGIWLVDENSGELFLEAEKGINDEKIRRLRLPIQEDSLMGRVIKTGQTQRVHRETGEEQIKVKTHYLVEGLIYEPIKLGDIPIGILAVVHRDKGKRFNSRDEQLLEGIADFAAIAIQNARIYQATDQALQLRVRELSALNEVTHAVSASLDLDQVYDVFVKQVNKHWPVEAVKLYLLDERRNEFFQHMANSEQKENIYYPVGEGIIGKAVESGESFVSNAVPIHPLYNPQIDSNGIEDLQSIACVPLFIQHRVVGALTLFNKREGFFSGEDLDRLKGFANPVAAAIENAQLFAKSEQRQEAILATARTFSQPLLILDEHGEVLVANQAANKLLETHIPQFLQGISESAGQTTEVIIGEQTYLSTADHMPGVGTIIIMQDITYVEQLEHDRSEFIHVLSHDLKTPLNSILGWADMLQSDISKEKKDEFAHHLMVSAERMLELIDQLLNAVTATDIGQIVEQPCDLEEIIQRVLSDAKGAAMHKAINLKFDLTGQPYIIRADEKRLYSMVLNLVDNAIKFSPNDTNITIKLAFSDYIIDLQVEDEGPGIPEQDIFHIFDKYYRGTRGKLYPGTGLGLSAVKAIADAHGGRVTVKNQPEGGAKFTVKLPGILRIPSEE